MDYFFGVFNLAEDVLQLGLVYDCLKVADGVDEFRSGFSVHGEGDSTEDSGGDVDIGEGDPLANDESARQ